jgi:hypothetical protein
MVISRESMQNALLGLLGEKPVAERARPIVDHLDISVKGKKWHENAQKC